jgi:hypothetical protein
MSTKRKSKRKMSRRTCGPISTEPTTQTITNEKYVLPSKNYSYTSTVKCFCFMYQAMDTYLHINHKLPDGATLTTQRDAVQEPLTEKFVTCSDNAYVESFFLCGGCSSELLCTAC